MAASTLVLLASGGLTGLQTAIIVSALPLNLIVLGMCYGLCKELGKEYKKQINPDWKKQEKTKPEKTAS